MKQHHHVVLLALLPLVGWAAYSQSFTRITFGPIAGDTAASRSVNWVDVNNDGYLDLFVSTGKQGGENDLLYINDGPDSNFSFRKVTNSPIVQDHLPSDGSSWADVFNNGALDAVVVAWYDSSNNFYTNDGRGNFTLNATSPIVTDRGYSETCSWGDYDNDGYVDLYVSNSAGTLRNFLYHNNHDGTFTRVTTGSIVLDQFKSRGVSWVDYDNDGDLDMFVVNEGGQNENLYRNMLKETGTATFTRITTGAIVNAGGNSMSASWGDIDNDGDLDVFVANGWPTASLDRLYLNNGDGTFTEVVNDTIVNTPGFHMGCAWGDFDNDGDLDLFVTTAYGPTASRNELYKNMLMETGTLSFQRVGTGDIVNDTGYSYGCAWGDYDRDGDLDLFVAKTFNEHECNALYRNDNTNGNHWLEVRCVGMMSNRSGIGAKIRIKATINGHPVWQLREVDGQSGYCGQNLDQHFGLGNATIIDTMKVEWPGGTNDVYTNVGPDRIVVAHEGSGLDGVDDTRGSIPPEFELLQNYPNPFNPVTSIHFSLPPGAATSHVGDPAAGGTTSLLVYDLLGREVATLVNEVMQPGSHTVQWDARGYASGVYLCCLSTAGFVRTRKLLLLR